MRSLYIVLLMIALLFVNACGGAAPTTPAQIPTIITMGNATQQYGDGAVLQMAKTLSATADYSFAGGEVRFTNDGVIDTTNTCASSTAIDGTTITITGPDTWPNAESMCELSFLYEGSVIPITSLSGSASPLMKANINPAASTSTSLPVYIDSSREEVDSTGAVSLIENVITNGKMMDITKLDTTLYMCYAKNDNTGLTLASSTNDGATFSTYMDLTYSPITSGACNIETRELSTGEDIIAVMVMGEDPSCEDDCSTMAYLRYISDGSITGTYLIANEVGSAEPSSINLTIDANGIVHSVENADGFGVKGVELTACCDADGIIDQHIITTDVQGNRSRVVIYGSNIYVTRVDASYNILVTPLTYASNVYTEGTTVTAVSAAGYSITSTITEMYPAIDNEGRIIIAWAHPNTNVGYLTVVNVSGGTANTYSFGNNVTNIAGPSVNITGNINLVFVANGDGAYLLGEYGGSGFTFSSILYMGISSYGDVNGTAPFVDPFGRMYYVFSRSGNISLIKLLLGS